MTPSRFSSARRPGRRRPIQGVDRERDADATFSSRTVSVGKQPTALAVLPDANGDGSSTSPSRRGRRRRLRAPRGRRRKSGHAGDIVTGLAPEHRGRRPRRGWSLGPRDRDTGDPRETILLGDGPGQLLRSTQRREPGRATPRSRSPWATAERRRQRGRALPRRSAPGSPRRSTAVRHGASSGNGSETSARRARSSRAGAHVYLLCDRAPVVIADVNLDGFTDIVAGNWDGTVSVFTGSVTGAFSPPTKVVLGSRRGPRPRRVRRRRRREARHRRARAGRSGRRGLRCACRTSTGPAPATSGSPDPGECDSGYGSSIDMDVKDVNGERDPRTS